jgi:hypothetical protein
MSSATVIKSIALSAAIAAAAGTAYANHAWGGYHWARSANPITLALGDNVSGPWDASLALASSDWSQSVVLNTYVTAGGTRPKNCRPTAGRVEVCNASYGSNGWLGIAQIWASGNHISQGVVKLNDTYFNTATYNRPAWRNLVTCQEVGHTFGLGHQDENFNNTNLGTCMDYTSSPDSNQHPNRHDYDMLVSIYSHVDGAASVNSEVASADMPTEMKGRDFDRQSSWGQLKKRSSDGAREIYVRDFGRGHKVITHVFWALEEGGPAHRQQRANED